MNESAGTSSSKGHLSEGNRDPFFTAESQRWAHQPIPSNSRNFIEDDPIVRQRLAIAANLEKVTFHSTQKPPLTELCTAQLPDRGMTTPASEESDGVIPVQISRDATHEPEMRSFVEDVPPKETNTTELLQTLEIQRAEIRSLKEIIEALTLANSSYGHELKTFLTSISGYTDLILAGGCSDTELKEFLTTIHNSAKLMNEMIDILRGFTKLNSTPPTLTQIPIKAAIEKVIEVLKAEIEISGVKMNVACNVPPVLSDHPRLVMLFQNLISNAIKYRRSDIALEITTSAEIIKQNGLNVCRVWVADNGRGIPLEHLDKIFRLFHRVDEVKATIQGTGLGLALCDRIIRELGSKIEVQSTVNVGSTFSFDLPMPELKQRAGQTNGEEGYTN